MNKIIISALIAAGLATAAPLTLAQPAGHGDNRGGKRGGRHGGHGRA